MKSGNFNFLEPSGPLQACNGTALPLLFIDTIEKTHFFCEVPQIEGMSDDLIQQTDRNDSDLILWLW